MSRLIPRTHGLLLLAALLAGGCRLERTPPPAETLPEPPVPVGLEPDGGLNRNRVIEAGRAGQYDRNPGSSHRAVIDGIADLTIEPLEGAYRTPKDAFDQGVVVARLGQQRRFGARPARHPAAVHHLLVRLPEGWRILLRLHPGCAHRQV
ncbi:MAG: hypothetical protein IPG75_11865 [Gemmatimonadetes bacterium]|nr:hypothetical protein [Gemmatimonadota bacterium]